MNTLVGINLWSTFLSTASTIGCATVDLGPYFNVGRREAIFAFNWCFTSASTAGTEVMDIHLEESSSTVAANAATVTAAIVAGSTYTSTASTSAISAGVQYAYVTLTKRYVRVVANTTTSTGIEPFFSVSASLLLEPRAV